MYRVRSVKAAISRAAVTAFVSLVMTAPSVTAVARDRRPLSQRALCPEQFRNLLAISKIARRPSEKRFRAGGVAVDTNVASVLERIQNHEPMDSESSTLIRTLSKAMKVRETELVDPAKRFIPVYYPETVVEEIAVDRERRNSGAFLTGSHMLRTDANLKTKLYEKVIEDLKAAGIGKNKGDNDRRIIAEVLLSQTEPGAVPAFATGDRGIFLGLCRKSATCEQEFRKNQVVPEQFDVEIQGRRLRVVPVYFESPKPR